MSYLVKLAISAALLAFLGWAFDIVTALRQLSTTDPLRAGLALALFFLFHAVNAAKLRVVLPRRPLGTLYAYILMAQAYALVLPGQIASEGMKAYRLARSGAGEASRVVSSVAFDKLTALVALCVTTLAGLVFGIAEFGAAAPAVVAMGLAALLVAGWALALEGTHRFLAAVLDGRGWRGWVGARVARFLDTWRRHAVQPRVLVASVSYGVAAQFVQALSVQLLADGLGVELPLASWCVVIGVMTVVLLVPATVGGIGLREASLVGLLGLFGVGNDRALALALAILACQIVIALAGLAVDILILRER